MTRANRHRRHMSSGEANRLAKLRDAAFHAQGGLCYYCRLHMWLKSLETEAEAMARLGIQRGKKGRFKRALNWRHATGEHLVQFKDGGLATSANIVAACAYCNTKRGDRSIQEWAVQRRMEVTGRSNDLRLRVTADISSGPCGDQAET